MTETRDHLLRPKPPYRLDLVVRALRRRPDNPVDRWDGRAWSRTVAVGGTVCRWTVRQDGPVEEPLLAARLELEPPSPADRGQTAAPGAGRAASTGEAAAWARLALDRLLGLSVDLSDFQAFAARDRPLRELAARWRGFRPPRFPTLFEALLNAVACQQITLTQGIRRLGALAARFGRNGRALPEPADLLGAPLPALRELGFSRQRAETLLRLAELAERGDLDAERFAGLDDAEALARLTRVKGVGPWSAQYALLRGLGRLGVFPVNDVGARQNIQRWLGLAETPDPAETRRLFDRHAPWQGMVYFLVLLDRLEDVPGL